MQTRDLRKVRSTYLCDKWVWDFQHEQSFSPMWRTRRKKEDQKQIEGRNCRLVSLARLDPLKLSPWICCASHAWHRHPEQGGVRNEASIRGGGRSHTAEGVFKPPWRHGREKERGVGVNIRATRVSHRQCCRSIGANPCKTECMVTGAASLDPGPLSEPPGLYRFCDRLSDSAKLRTKLWRGLSEVFGTRWQWAKEELGKVRRRSGFQEDFSLWSSTD